MENAEVMAFQRVKQQIALGCDSKIDSFIQGENVKLQYIYTTKTASCFTLFGNQLGGCNLVPDPRQPYTTALTVWKIVDDDQLEPGTE